MCIAILRATDLALLDSQLVGRPPIRLVLLMSRPQVQACTATCVQRGLVSQPKTV